MMYFAIKNAFKRFPSPGPLPTLGQMYSSVLSVLLMGMVPVLHDPGAVAVPIDVLQVAAPSPLAQGLLESMQGLRSVSASGVVVLDLQSGQQVYGRSERLRHPMGSLTKLMTALVIIENHALGEKVKVPADIGTVEGSKVNLAPGRRYTVGDLLSALLISSANDAAVTLARFHSGSSAAFVKLMNERAASLGLKDTSFANAAGLDDPKQWSTPRDIALLALYVQRQNDLRARMALPTAVIKDDLGRTTTLVHTHDLLHESTPVVAGKTGTTVAAGECLLSIIREGSREYAVVLLGSRNRYADMRSILAALKTIFA